MYKIRIPLCATKAKVHEAVRSNCCLRLRLCQKTSTLLSKPKTSVNEFLIPKHLNVLHLLYLPPLCHFYSSPYCPDQTTRQ